MNAFCKQSESAEISLERYCLKESTLKGNHLSPKNKNQGQHCNTTNLSGVRLEEHQYLTSKLHHQQKPNHQTKQKPVHPPDVITRHLLFDLEDS